MSVSIRSERAALHTRGHPAQSTRLPRSTRRMLLCPDAWVTRRPALWREAQTAMQRCHGHDSSLVMWARPDPLSETNAIHLARGARTLYVPPLQGVGEIDLPPRLTPPSTPP